jgi:glucosamine--fructose-6-phosphate aminotransferase (isomerizing)
VVVVATEQAVAEKTLSNLREVTARGASPFVVTSPENAALFAAYPSFALPRATEALYPFLAASALQLYAYHAAVLRGCAVDQPRNLAKSVTVE